MPIYPNVSFWSSFDIGQWLILLLLYIPVQSSVPGSTNTTTTTTTHPVGRIQIAAEDPDDDTQPLYVNARQYHRILKRRAARAKLESSGKVVRKRKVSDENHCSKPLDGLYSCCLFFLYHFVVLSSAFTSQLVVLLVILFQVLFFFKFMPCSIFLSILF